MKAAFVARVDGAVLSNVGESVRNITLCDKLAICRYFAGIVL